MAVFCKFDKIVIEPFKFAYLGGRERERRRERKNSDGSKQDFYQSGSGSQAEFTPACPQDLPMLMLCRSRIEMLSV